MNIERVRLTLHEPLYFATREIGRLYETGQFLHNYALTYALGLANAPFLAREQIPRYAEQLAEANERGIYVTPARGVAIEYALATFKYADNRYHVAMEPGRFNTPSFGRAKEIAPESVFEFFVLSADRIELPRWIRLGKWASKAIVVSEELREIREVEGEFEASCALNPLDVMGQLLVYDLVSMPPASLIYNARLRGAFYECDEGRVKIPLGLQFRFPQKQEAASRLKRIKRNREA